MLQEFLRGSAAVCICLAAAASFMLTLRRFVRIPDELFRKTLHFILLGTYIPFAFAFETWWLSVLLALVLEVLIYPALALAGRLKAFSAFVNERSRGELKRSMLLAFTMLAVCNAVCWGWLGSRCLGLACMYAWGVGDAFAALIGKRFGRRRIPLKHVDPHKTCEGSAAMLVTSFAAAATVLLLQGRMHPAASLTVALAGAAAATATEMFTPRGLDTVTCPAAAMLVMIPLTSLMGGLA